MYLDWKTAQEDYYTIDIETDDLDATVIWCLCWQNVKTNEKGECVTYEEMRDFFATRKGSKYVGHNILKFDTPTLNRLLSVGINLHDCIDTLVLSTVYSPSIEGGHSLDAWGERMGKPKIKFNDWSGLSPEMITYCHMDVAITTELFRRLASTLARINFSEKSIWLQHQLTCIIEEQHKAGFQFDGARAIELYQILRKKEEDLQDDIRLVFPAERVLVAERPLRTKSGAPTAIYQKDCERFELEESPESNSYRAFERIDFNIGSSKQRTGKLLELGWEPEEFTEKTKKGGGGNPKPFDKGELSPSLQRFVDENPTPEVEMIARWMSVNGRANMINTWLENWNEDDGRIHGKLYVANTLRFRHQAPNTANIPAVRVKEYKDGAGNVVRKEVLRGDAGYYTYEARDLWCARPGRVLVGTDAAGLELRMLAHYLNRAEFTRQVLEGDPHQYNADVVGITRPQAKTLLYAIMYGAAAPKVSKQLKVPVKEGAIIRNNFLERLGLKELMDEVQAEQRAGRIELIDGSQVICPSPHSALNYKLQGGGARVMGLALVLLDKQIRREGLDVIFVGNIHDEWQADVHPDDADRYAEISEQVFIETGVRLNMNLPLAGKAKKGLTWSETH